MKNFRRKFFRPKFFVEKKSFFPNFFIFLEVLNYDSPVSEYELLTPKTKKVVTDSPKKISAYMRIYAELEVTSGLIITVFNYISGI